MLGRSLPKYESVDIKLLLEDGNSMPVECVGKVVWSIPARVFRRQTTAFDTGVEFTNLSKDNGDRIEKYLAVQANGDDRKPADSARSS